MHFLRTVRASLTAADNIPKEILSVFPRPQQTYFTLRVLCMHTAGVGCCLLLLSISVGKGVNWRFPELIIARLPSPIPSLLIPLLSFAFVWYASRGDSSILLSQLGHKVWFGLSGKCILEKNNTIP